MKRIIKKSISILISLLVMLVLIGSAFYIVKHVNHHCSEKNCAVCMELASCHSNIHDLGTACAADGCLKASFIGLIAYIICSVFSVSKNPTLISLKVELLN